jgi:cytochrome c-type biogenesis protein CcmF
MRVWWKPFVTFIWYGGIMIALGGVLAIAGRVRVDLRRRRVARLAQARRADLAALSGVMPAPAE